MLRVTGDYVSCPGATAIFRTTISAHVVQCRLLDSIRFLARILMFSPASILLMWLRGLLSIAVLAGGIYLACRWYARLPEATVIIQYNEDGTVTKTRVPATFVQRVRSWRPGGDATTAFLAGGLFLLGLSSAGGWIYPRVFCRAGGFNPGERPQSETSQITRPDGTQLNVETYGSKAAPRLIMTHGWGCDRQMWHYAVTQLSEHYRIVIWDLPGLGLSTQPLNGDYSVVKMANDLRAVLEATGSQPAVLVGHSIGGMITLTFCKLFPELLSRSVVGISIVQSTYTNPLRTTRFAGLLTAIEMPVIRPLLALTIFLSPVVWLLNCLSYWNGSAHRSAARGSFAGQETRGQLDFAARYNLKVSPSVVARGMLGMLHYDAEKVLSQIQLPAQVIVGDLDSTTLPEAGTHMAGQMPQSKLLCLSPARHFGFFEKYDEFNTVLHQFVSKCFSRPAG